MSRPFNKGKLKSCRFCARAENSVGKLVDLTKSPDYFQNCMNILEFFSIRSIDFSVDSLPKTICEPCHNSMNAAYVFFKKVEQTQLGFTIKTAVKIERAVETVTAQPLNLTSSYGEYKPKSKTPNSKDKSKVTNAKKRTRTSTKPRVVHKRNRKRRQQHSESEAEDFVYAGVAVFSDEIGIQHVKQENIKFERVYMSDNSDSDYVEFTYAGYPIYNDHDKPWAYYTWVCGLCHERFDTMTLLRQHGVASHNTCFTFGCDECSHRLENYDDFIEHYREHRDNLRYFCKYCDHYNETIEECATHEKTHQDYFHICSLCGELFKDAVTLSQHKKDVSESGNLSQEVKQEKKDDTDDDSLSSVSFDEPLDTVGHEIPQSELVIDTWKDYPWICPLCSISFPSIDQWRCHMKIRHGRCAAYRCFDCKRYRCRKLRHLLGHIRQHRPNLRLQCHFCYEVKQSQDALRKHVSGHLQNYFWCDHCGEKFTEENALKEHLKEYKKPLQVKRKHPLTPEELTCHICKKILKTKGSLRLHLNIHGFKNFSCEICGQTFSNDCNLRDHLLRHDKQYQCDFCDKLFARRCHIIRHIATHLDTKPFSCEECGHKCRNISALKQHKIKHSSALPFVCQICNKAFKRALYLKKHEVQHTGEKPYNCKFCNIAFANSANCHKHMKRIHGTTHSN